MRSRLLIALALVAGLFSSTGRTVQAQTGFNVDDYNGAQLHAAWIGTNIWGACNTTWDTVAGEGYKAVPVVTYGGCAANGTAQVVTVYFVLPAGVYIDNIKIWGSSKGRHFGQFNGGNVAKSSGWENAPSNYETIYVHSYVQSGNLYLSKWGYDYTTYDAVRTSIYQIEIVWSGAAPTETPTNTPRPTSTPNPTATSYPTATQANTSIPTHLPQTVIAPQLTPYATIDTCPSDDIRTPCANPMYSFPTMAVPTFNLPSPTAIALLPTNTPAPLTFTPSPTFTPTSSNTPAPTAGSSPTATPTTNDILPTLNVTAWYDGGNALGAAIPSLVPMIGIGFDVGGSQTPVGIESAAEQLGTGAGRALAVAKSLELTDINRFGGIISFGFLIFIFSVLIEVAILILPLIEKFLHWLWRLIKLIPFIE